VHELCGRVCTFVRVTEGTMYTICPYVVFCSPYGGQCHAIVNFGDGGCDRNSKSRISFSRFLPQGQKYERVSRD
jgi:hypothetical protein